MKFLFFYDYKCHCKYKEIYGAINCHNFAVTKFNFYKNKLFIELHNPYFEGGTNNLVKYYYLNGYLIGTNSKRQFTVLNKLYIKNYFLFKNNKQWRKYVKMQVFK